MQVKTYDVVYDDSIRCRTSDLRHRINIRHRIVTMSYVLRHRMLRCRTCLTYDIDIRCRTSYTYDIVGVRCRTCMTYDIVCNIGIIRCRTSDVRHRRLARIQMKSSCDRCVVAACNLKPEPLTPSAKWAVHIYYQYAKSEQCTILHIDFGLCILFCILLHIYAE
jgi:hypothetical protein